LEPEAAIVGRFVEQKDGWQRFETLDFQIDVPPGFDFIAAPQEQPLPGSPPPPPPPPPPCCTFS